MRWWRVAVGLTVVMFGIGQGAGTHIAHAASLTVCSSGCPYTTIGAAVSASSPNDTISIGAGFYAERLTISSPVILQADPTLPAASGATGVVIDGGGLGTVITIGAGVAADLTNLTIQNGFGTNGGGIDNEGYLVLTGDTITGNQSATGAGIYDHGSLTVTNSTIANNTISAAFNVYGGGIDVVANPSIPNGGVSLTNSTIAGNTLTASSGSAASGGGIYTSGATVQLVNTIVAHNSATNGPDCFGTVSSLGHNLIGDGTSCSGVSSASGDQVGTSASPIDPKLGPLQDNGGGTSSMAPLPGSPAIDAGADASCPSNDQLGAPRPQGVYCDIGAIELQSQLYAGPLPSGMAFTTCASASSPCPRIAATIARALPGGTITIAAGNYVENLILDRNLTLNGAGANSTILDGKQAGTVVTVIAGAPTTITGVTIQNGKGSEGAGGIIASSGLTLSHSRVTDNTGGFGGGIYVVNVPFTISASTIDHNESVSGAGIVDDFNGATPQKFEITNSTIADNSATLPPAPGVQGGKGGGIISAQPGTLTNVTISGNQAASTGGGIYSYSPITLSNTILAGNYAPAGADPDCYSSLISGGHNLLGVSDSPDCTWHGAVGDTVGYEASPLDPLLGPLQANGGPTPTMAPLKGSPAVGGGDASVCGATTGTLPVGDQDQRGTPRQSGSRSTCDIGAYDTAQAVNLALSSFVGPQLPGQSLSLTVKAVNAVDGTAATGWMGDPVYLTSSDSAAGLPTSYTYTASDRGSHTFTVTLPDAGGQTLYAFDANNPPKGQTTVRIGLPISTGWTLLDLPTQNSGITSLAGLIAALTKPDVLGTGAVRAAGTYAGGRFQVYVPGYSADVPLASSQGVFVNSSTSGPWVPPGTLFQSSQPLSLTPGWNLVAAPYPHGGIAASTIAAEVSGCAVQEIATYSSGSYQIWTPTSGTDLTVPTYGGAWIECSGQGSWTPSKPAHP